MDMLYCGWCYIAIRTRSFLHVVVARSTAEGDTTIYIYYLIDCNHLLTMNTRLFQVISTTASFTFVCALNAVLLQWTFYSQALFSRTTILCFRAVVIILFIPDVISYVLAIIMSTIRHIDIGEEILYVISNYIGFTMQIVNVITYSGLAIFFGYSAHRLRRHDKPRTRFALLTVFTIIVFISDVITLTESIITSYFDKMNVVLSHKRWFAFSAMGHLEFVSYSIACLIILGVCYQGCNNAQGPRQHKPPLGGMTTIEYEPSVKDIDITVVVGSNTERDLFRPPQRPRCHSSSVKSEKTIIEIA
ncbi:hypothetical protein BDF22DRAFT_316057 [Syncephalis plumigaleata]|nr:hypothetical protein BDF22DRAFT_316057 [Syncephalis plumigaleata]